jgi:2-C-methyl-D-erythritol 4-phosphate cytidylyltransferase
LKNIAIILAGGIGARVGGALPKQLLPLADGRTILEHAIDAFQQAECIDEICLVMHYDYMAYAQDLSQTNEWSKLKHIVPGGNERWESSVNAIRLYMDQPSTSFSNEDVGYALLLHDAARPFVSQDIIANVCQALETHEAVVVAVPSTDTVYEMVEDKVARIPNRQTIMRAQTPQAFHLPLIAEAYAKALGVNNLKEAACNKTNLPATDDCSIVFKHMPQVAIHIVPGEEQNKKITYKEDL